MPEAVIIDAVRTPIWARILTTLLHEISRRAPDEQRPYHGLATLCVGVGQGEATIVEWIGDVPSTT